MICISVDLRSSLPSSILHVLHVPWFRARGRCHKRSATSASLVPCCVPPRRPWALQRNGAATSASSRRCSGSVAVAGTGDGVSGAKNDDDHWDGKWKAVDHLGWESL